MVTRKQGKEYQRLHKVLLDTYHEKEKGREAILILFQGILDFTNLLSLHTDIIYDVQEQYNVTIDQQLFLESLLVDYKVISNKAKVYSENTRSIFEEVMDCMEEMSNVRLEIGSEETDKKTSEIILTRMNKRIEESKNAISKNILELNDIITGFEACKARYNSRKN